MRALLQRVAEAQVAVDGEVVGQIGHGLAVLLGIARSDTEQDAEKLTQQILSIRIFSPEGGKMQSSVVDVQGGILLVSQFTLYADLEKGRRPDFGQAAPLLQARHLYEHVLSLLRAAHVPVEAGIFQAHMKLRLVNDGPVTILCSTDRIPPC